MTANDAAPSPATEPADADSPTPVRYLSLELTGDGIAEWDDHQRAVFVPRDAIVGIELRRGLAGERPIVQVVFGVVALVLGVVMLGAFTVAAAHPRTAGRFTFAGGTVAAVGAYLLWTALRPALFLYVRLRGDARKVLIRGKVDLPSLAEVLREASVRF